MSFYQTWIDPKQSNLDNMRRIWKMTRGNYLFLMEKTVKNKKEKVNALVNQPLCQEAVQQSGEKSILDFLILKKQTKFVQFYFVIKCKIKGVLNS